MDAEARANEAVALFAIAALSYRRHTFRYKGPTVMLLIVDDDPTFLERAQELLRGEGRGIFFARNAEHAKELMDTVGDGFSVAMIDLDLPGQDGFSLISDIRRDFPGLPVIAISGVVPEHVLESAKVLGAAETLSKPIGPEWSSAIARARAARGRYHG